MPLFLNRVDVGSDSRQRSCVKYQPACRAHDGSRLAAVWLCLILVGALGCATGQGLTREQAIEKVYSVGTLTAQLNSATEEGLDMLAPAGFAAAQSSLDDAIANAQAGKDAEAERFAQNGIARLERARAESRRTTETLREVLAGRRRAVAAGAPTLLTDRFEDLEAELREAARLAEGGDLEGAKDATPDLLRGYSSLELDALKMDATDLARVALDKAREAGADENAPDTFRRAQKELDIAEGILETDRTQTEQANVHARRAYELATRSEFLSELAKEFDRRDYDREEVLLWYQEQLEDLTSPLEQAIVFSKPNHEAIAEARERIAAAVRGRRAAESQLADAKSRIEALESTSTASLAAQREAEARYERVSSMFTEDEAVVYRSGNNVLLTTYGFEFPVGESEIRSSNFPLLNKIARAISEFDKPSVVVSGHTDATGSGETNQRLSEERAQKVGAFLVEVDKISPNRVETKGYGESKPVASNETPDGRARNRRIEILIVNQADGLASSGLPAVGTAPPTK